MRIIIGRITRTLGLELELELELDLELELERLGSSCSLRILGKPNQQGTIPTTGSPPATPRNRLMRLLAVPTAADPSLVKKEDRFPTASWTTRMLPTHTISSSPN